MIEANFANRDGILGIKDLFERGKIVHLSILHIKRVNAKRRPALPITMANCGNIGKIIPLNSRHQDASYARTLGIRHHLITIAIKFARIQVTVRIDQHASHCVCT
jgi:hypothetical protein